jgi:hypothetical protein
LSRPSAIRPRVSPYSIQELLASDLLRDEEVIWTGQPDPKVLFSKADAFLIPFSLIWGGFALFWEGAVIASLLAGDDHSGNGGSLYFFVVFGVPFVLMGLYFIFGRFIYKRIKKKKTYYVITNKRAISLSTFPGRNLKSAFLDQMASIEKAGRVGGIGSITFGNQGWMTQYENTGMDFFAGAMGESRPNFFDIHDIDRVYEVIMSARDEARRASLRPEP